ncbi:MAG TPA: SRPBCC domain-containing protein [Acidimicrobiales bacterium]|nr:SRPBCC domain-containing protein [Acidimicrobiales bacterium]
MIEALRIDLEVDCPPAHAFATWTERFGQWWPHGHTVTGDPDAVVLEPHAGGRIYERTHDGREVDWGEITAWEPPRRLAYLWHIRRDRLDATDVEITFTDRGDGTTRVEIIHSGWERLGDNGRTWRDANRGGWAGLLPVFIAACTSTTTTTPTTASGPRQEPTP